MRGRYVIAAVVAAMLVWAAAALAIVSTGGSKKADVAVPRVLGLRGDDAATKLEAAGLKVNAYEHLEPSQRSSEGLSMTTKQSLAGVVVAQSPSAGISVHPGSTVELSVEHTPTR
jgi:beta-lactam-binding protein with PASTA domain